MGSFGYMSSIDVIEMALKGARMTTVVGRIDEPNGDEVGH